jgi:hypothetical protein
MNYEDTYQVFECFKSFETRMPEKDSVSPSMGDLRGYGYFALSRGNDGRNPWRLLPPHPRDPYIS